MKHYLFVNKYNSKLYSVDKMVKKESFNYFGERLEIINNTGLLDIEKEEYVLCPKESPFKIGYEHFFSLDNICGVLFNKITFVIDFLDKVFKMIDDLKNIVIVFSNGAIDELDMTKFNSLLKNIFNEYEITAIIKDYLFTGTITFLSLANRKSIALASGFNVIKSKIEGNNLRRTIETIWEDKKETLENIKYYQGYVELINESEYQRAFDLALDTRLNYGSNDIMYETRDHKYKIDAHILDDYILKLKENIKKVSDKDMFYLFDISFPLIYDEYVKALDIDINKTIEIEDYYKYVIEYSEIILKYNTPYYRILSKKKKLYSLSDGYTEYEIEFLTNKKRKELKAMFTTKYIKES